jgi:hypothetical protein
VVLSYQIKREKKRSWKDEEEVESRSNNSNKMEGFLMCALICFEVPLNAN